MDRDDMQALWEHSGLSGGSLSYLEGMYEAYLQDPQSVEPAWKQYFDTFIKQNAKDQIDVPYAPIREHYLQMGKRPRGSVVVAVSSSEEQKLSHINQYITAYRAHGHHIAQLDPLNLREVRSVPDLDLSFHQLSSADLDKTFAFDTKLCNGKGTLRQLQSALQKVYGNALGVEYLHISNVEEVSWLTDRLENAKHQQAFDVSRKQHILGKLTAAEGLEKYLASKYVGQKRFGLEGGESFIPMLDEIVHRAGAQGVKETVVGMAHRGRLNVLVNILGKSPAELFAEFEGKFKNIEESMTGDVKYHLGFSSDIKTPGGNMHLALSFNPSHLEIISPVVEGSVRARQQRRNDKMRSQVLPIMVHGDSAIAGQGVVMETFNMSQARGYTTGGTIHIVLNNQVGFTTSNPLDTRSTLYCTDIAKVVQAPVFHVNGDCPESVVWATQIALDYRMKFGKDVVLDLVCYRRHGHNESDEPSGTQPIMYRTIKKHPTTRKLYADKLVAASVLDEAAAKSMVDEYRKTLDEGKCVLEVCTKNKLNEFAVDWQPYLGHDWRTKAATGVKLSVIKSIAGQLETLPAGFVLQAQVKKAMKDRAAITQGEHEMNWGYAETMAYATLLHEGFPVRLSGQDSGRGTFSHRHAALHHHETGEVYTPLKRLGKVPTDFTVIDSVLSEEAVLAFEYGYATADPESLVIWEAQFGDFANGAQVVIDQFISSGYQKWGRLCGLVMFLPHGYEGQGPEHSSARLERYLQLCAQHNMQVCMPTTPAQIFHLLRRQMIRPWRMPLVVMTPKSLLRHPMATSPLIDLEKGKFHDVIPEIEPKIVKPSKARKVVLCSGKVYYELLQRRRERELTDVAVIRIEQLYPFPEKELKAELKKYTHAETVVWCQEEPMNQGAWHCTRHRIVVCLQPKQTLEYAGRVASASPAAGMKALHDYKQNKLVEDALK